MPVVGISTAKLFSLLQKELSMNKLLAAMQHIGCDVDETKIIDVELYECPKCFNIVEVAKNGQTTIKCSICGSDLDAENFRYISSDSVIRIELLAVRPDLFDVAGLARALKGYLDIETNLAKYKANQGQIDVRVASDVNSKECFRPYIVCAEVKMPPIDSLTLKDIMNFQESLHWALGRNRKKASIGVYDMSNITPPIYYQSVDPDNFRFVPLGSPSQEMTPREILEKHPKGIEYQFLLKDYKQYPLLIDSKNQVLSMPPIINSEETKLKAGSSHFFIDITGPEMTAIEDTLAILSCSFADLGGDLYSVKIIYPDREQITPDLSEKQMKLSAFKTHKLLGIEIPPSNIVHYLKRMRFDAEIIEDDNIMVTASRYRIDLRHEVDLIEDVAIAYGYHNIEPKLVSSATIGKERKIEMISNLTREMLIGLGFMETLSFMLTNPDTAFKKLNLDENEATIYLENPISIEHTIVRSHLLDGIMNFLSLNKKKGYPQRIFQIGNCCEYFDGESKSDEPRKLAIAIADYKAGFADIRSILDSIFYELDMKVDYTPNNLGIFLTGRGADLIIKRNTEEKIGLVGEIHPEVLINFGLSSPVAVAEINLSNILRNNSL